MEPLLSYAMSYCPPSEEIFGLSSTTWSVVTGLSSFAIALLALIFTGIQLRRSQKHNQLTVTPHLVTSFDAQRVEGTVKLCIKNTGIGPARITEYKMYVDENRVLSADPSYSAAALLSEGRSVHGYAHGGLCRDMFISAGEERCIFEFNMINPANTQEFFDGLTQRFQLVISYESIYGIYFEFDLQRDLASEYSKNHTE